MTSIRIWPSIVGGICAILFFNLAILMVLALYVYAIGNMKVTDCTENAYNAMTVMDTEFVNEIGDKDRLFKNITELMPEIEGIEYLDGNRTVLEGYGESIAFGDYTQIQNAITDLADMDIYLEKGVSNFVSMNRDSRKLVVDVPTLMRLPLNNGLKMSFTDTDWLTSEQYGTDVAFVYRASSFDGYIALTYRLSFNTSDYIYMVAVCGVVTLLFTVVMIYHIISMISLVGNRKRAYDALYVDMATGCSNVLAFYKKSEKLIKSAKRTDIKYAVVNLKLEKYKSFLSYYGMEWCDELMKRLYKSIDSCLSKKETIGIVGKSDFALLTAYSDEAALNGRLKTILKKLSDENPEQKIRFSAGVCKAEDTKTLPQALYNNAALARSEMKDEMAGEIQWFSTALSEKKLWERKVEDEMENAMETGQFEMFLQPKYDPGTEELGGAEALVRWRHPVEGLIPPGKFIPIFEANGFILKLDDFMIGQVAKYQAKWISEGRKVVPISVNVSRAHFMREDLAEHIRDIVDSYNVPHDVVELELTESAFFDDKKTLISIVARMREYGFHVSMDDFGSGYSSLNTLKEIPLDVVKLDAEFFRGEGSEERGRLIVSETIGLAKNLGMNIVAEGIETKDQVEFLKNLNCDLIQGYYFAKPMPIADYEERAFGCK